MDAWIVLESVCTCSMEVNVTVFTCMRAHGCALKEIHVSCVYLACISLHALESGMLVALRQIGRRGMLEMHITNRMCIRVRMCVCISMCVYVCVCHYDV